MHFIESFQVNQTAPVAFAYAADFRHLPNWDPSITSVEMTTAGPVKLGTKFRVRLSFLGLPSELDYEVVEWNPPQRAVLRATNSFVTAIDTVEVEERSAGAKVRWDAEIRFVFPISLVDAAIAAAFRSSVVAAVRGLRMAIQAQSDASHASIRS